MKRKDLWIMCGPPASGKSTFANFYFTKDPYWSKKSWIIVSRDKIRFSFLKKNSSTNYFEHESEVFNEYVKTIIPNYLYIFPQSYCFGSFSLVFILHCRVVLPGCVYILVA